MTSRLQSRETGGMKGDGIKGWVWGTWSRVALTVALVTAVLDQANKLWLLLVYRIKESDQIRVLPFLDIVLVYNTGVSYNLGAGTVPWWALVAFAAVAVMALTVWVARACTGRLMAGSVGLIMGGAVGNAIDRTWLPGVADFYLLHAFGYQWYVFNIADVAIVAGVIGLLYESFWPSRQGATNAP